MRGYTLECCVDSVESAIAATQGGASRLELCADLPLGGTTPGINLYRQVKKHCPLPVHVLVRPRFGDFCYSPHELDIIEADVRMFAQEGANSVVLGVLSPNGHLDIAAMRRLILAAQTTKITLHRAFDMCADPLAALEECIELGISAILTSGQKNSAVEGASQIAALHRAAANRLEIIAGAGVCSDSIQALAIEAQTNAFHMSGKVVVESAMQYRRNEVNMGLPLMSEYSIWRTSAEEVRAVKTALDSIYLP